MNVANLITLVRNQANVSSSNIADSVIIDYLNIAYHDIENAIVDRVDEDYFRDFFTADTVADQNEYTLQTGDNDTQGIKKVLRVELKYQTSDDYNTLYRGDALSNQTVADAYEQNYASHSNGRWEYRDGSIFVYPAPDNAVTNGLRVHVIKDLIDLVSGGAESTVFPNASDLRQYHHIIALGAIPYVLRHRNVQDSGVKNDAINNYNFELEKMIVYLNSKNPEPQEVKFRSLEQYY